MAQTYVKVGNQPNRTGYFTDMVLIDVPATMRVRRAADVLVKARHDAQQRELLQRANPGAFEEYVKCTKGSGCQVFRSHILEVWQVIRTPTVFVLGAGASKDYGFPLGWELVDEVIKRFVIKNDERRRFLECSGFKESDLKPFIDALNGSAQNSVDAFLEYRREFMEIGKAAMSWILIQREVAGELFKNRNASTNWLRYLVQQLRPTTFEEFADNKVSFITFNYDRSLEFFLCRTLADTFGKTDDEAGAVVGKIPIVHVHGRLGYLPWQLHEHRRKYTSEVNSETLKMCSKEITVMHESADAGTPEFDQAKELLSNANRIYFMGVGFNNLNMTRLGIGSLKENIAIATGKGILQSDHNRLQQLYRPRMNILQNCDCVRMVTEEAKWD